MGASGGERSKMRSQSNLERQIVGLKRRLIALDAERAAIAERPIELKQLCTAESAVLLT